MGLKLVIADDDSGMRLVLKKALKNIEGINVVGEAEDGESLLELYEATKPDIVFVDVEMPKLSGVECAKRIMDINPKTIIIFATAHSQYMPEAFEIYAFDYLVKPFKVERIHQTLNRVKTIGLNHDDPIIYKMMKHDKGLEKLIVKNKEGVSFIDVNEIIIIQRENRSTAIYTESKNYMTSESLCEVEEKLDKAQFFRTHKSYIINLSKIDRIYPYGRWTYIIKLKGTDRDALLTHEKYLEMEKLFSV